MGSYAETTQQDWRTVAEGEVVVGPGAQIAMPGGVIIGERAFYMPRQEFTPEVAQAMSAILESSDKRINDLVGLTQEAVSGVFGLSDVLAEQIAAAQEVASKQIATTQETTSKQVGQMALGEPSIFTQWLPYIVIGLFALVVVTR